MLTTRELETLAVYEKRGRQRQIDTVPIWADSFTMDIFSYLSGEGRVIDIGCGHGRFISLLDDLGIPHEGYLGVDPSPEQIGLGRELWPDHAFEVGDIYTVGERHPERFDGFWCATVLMHLPRERLDEGLVSLRGSLKKGAVGLVSTPFGEGGCVNRHGMELTLYGIEEIEEAFKKAGFLAGFHTPDFHMLLGSIIAV